MGIQWNLLPLCMKKVCRMVSKKIVSIMIKDYKKVTTKNGNTYVGYFVSDNEFMTTFGWTIKKEDIKTIKDN